MAVLSILSSDPENLEENVFIDKALEITFSHTVHDSSLTTDMFRIYVMPGYSGQVAIKSITKSGPTVTIVPENDFEPNQRYVLWMMGDKDTDDLDLIGVASETGATLDGIQLIHFTTGTKKTNADQIIEEISVVAEQVEDIQQATPNGILDVFGTTPADMDTDIGSGLTDIYIKFDHDIVDIDMTVGDDMSGVISIEADPLIPGQVATVPEITSINSSGHMLHATIEPYGISENTEYYVIVQSESVVGTTGELMPYDYEFRFLAEISPAYTTVRMVRRKGGFLVPKSIPDIEIMAHILDASIWVNEYMGRSTLLPEPVSNQIMLATTWQAICTLATSASVGDLRFVRDKQLADLRVVYNTDAVKELLDEYCHKATDILAGLGFGGAQHGVKSGSSASGNYPGFKRTIQNYPRRRFNGCC